jgi:hypothetical protein
LHLPSFSRKCVTYYNVLTTYHLLLSLKFIFYTDFLAQTAALQAARAAALLDGGEFNEARWLLQRAQKLREMRESEQQSGDGNADSATTHGSGKTKRKMSEARVVRCSQSSAPIRAIISNHRPA